jgi:hypothetical protein
MHAQTVEHLISAGWLTCLFSCSSSLELVSVDWDFLTHCGIIYNHERLRENSREKKSDRSSAFFKTGIHACTSFSRENMVMQMHPPLVRILL